VLKEAKDLVLELVRTDLKSLLL